MPEHFDSHCTLNESAFSFAVRDFKFAAAAVAFTNMLLYAAADSELKQILPIEAVKQVVYFITKNSPTLLKLTIGISACVTFRRCNKTKIYI